MLTDSRYAKDHHSIEWQLVQCGTSDHPLASQFAFTKALEFGQVAPPAGVVTVIGKYISVCIGIL